MIKKNLNWNFFILILMMTLSVNTAYGALTLESLVLESDGALTLTSAVSSDINLGNTLTTGNINIGGIQTTGNIILAGTSGSVAIGTLTPNANSILDITSTTKAFLPPRMTTVQKEAIASPTAGMIVFDSTINNLSVYTSAWENIKSTNYGLNNNFTLLKSNGTEVKYATLQAAVDAATSGETITVKAGTYSENVTISTENLKIRGDNAFGVILSGTINVSATIGEISDVQFTGTLNFSGQTLKHTFVLNRCNIFSDLNIGSVGTPIKSNVSFYNCAFSDSSKSIYFNASTSQESQFFNCRTLTWTDGQSLTMVASSRVHFYNSSLSFYDVTLRGNSMSFSDPYPIITVYGGEFQVVRNLNTENSSVIAIHNAQFLPAGCLNGGTVTLDDNVELDIFNSTFGGCVDFSLVFNSIANSRMDFLVSLHSFAGLSGTGLGNLYIQNSIMRMANPGGLGGSDGTIWSQFTDL